jgi:hypothetical protein
MVSMHVNNVEANRSVKWAGECTGEDSSFPKTRTSKLVVSPYLVVMHCAEDSAFRICHAGKAGK